MFGYTGKEIILLAGSFLAIFILSSLIKLIEVWCNFSAWAKVCPGRIFPSLQSKLIDCIIEEKMYSLVLTIFLFLNPNLFVKYVASVYFGFEYKVEEY